MFYIYIDCNEEDENDPLNARHSNFIGKAILL
jgi:hypothetical protein